MERASTWDKTWVFFAEQSLGASVSADLPSIRDFIDPVWLPPDKDRILAYLENAPSIVTSGPPSNCCLCQMNVDGVRCWHSDGLWVWRGDLSHYVREHSVRLPDAMVRHIRTRDYVLPSASDVNWLGMCLPG